MMNIQQNNNGMEGSTMHIDLQAKYRPYFNQLKKSYDSY